MTVDEFIERWTKSGAGERSNFQSFMNELCELIGVPRPDPAEGANQTDSYVFERPVTDPVSGTTKFIDLYRRGSFVLEGKQGVDKKARPKDVRQYELKTGETWVEPTRTGTAVRGTPGWAKAMAAAKQQAWNYAHALDLSEGWPPFLIVVDVGHVIELYSDFSGSGKNYTQFQDGRRFRISMEDLRDEKVRETLRLVWTKPQELDPAKVSAQVTRKIAERLAALGKSFEEQGHNSEKVARFLMRCLFTMFAEDVELIPKDSFTNLLIRMRDNVEAVQPTLQELWTAMDRGHFSVALSHDLLKFNGGLFAEADALPINRTQLHLLINAAEADWRDVEPAIFGTLLERALSPKERHKLGAHYTPRAYVERLVTPTIIEPLRADWDAVKAAAFDLAEKGDEKAARGEVRTFHRTLCDSRVLDPACGSGNFLYVAMEQMKRLEGEVLDTLSELGEGQARLQLTGETVDPHQFLGIEINPWAAAVAELVLWIGYLQWHFKTFGKATPSEPVLKDFHNIECRDALLVLEGETPRLDADGKPVTRWDGAGMQRHPVTGEMVPDPAARLEVLDYEKAKPAVWPEANFIVGNPPFIGASRMRDALGDGYAEVLWDTYPKMPQSADFVMYWWEKAAKLAKAYDAAKHKGVRRFGFITTNSLRQTFNRRVLEPYLDDRKKPLSLLFAIPDHPWVDAEAGAAVRIAMTVAAAGRREGRLLTLESESRAPNESDIAYSVEFRVRRGKIHSNIAIGPDLISIKKLHSNEELSSKGMTLHGQGFVLSNSEVKQLRESSSTLFSVLKPYFNGRDFVQNPSSRWVIDLFGLEENEVRGLYPEVYQHLLNAVKPEREQNNRASYREKWWLFGEPRADLRPKLAGIDQMICTARTAKHRVFSLVPADTIPESEIIVFALERIEFLAVLNSKVHVVWALATGSVLGPTPRYNHDRCFTTFPFPDCRPAQTETLRDLGERLDAHRKARQAAHPKLTLTQMYNVLERLREIEATGSGEVIEGKEKTIYEQGQIGTLRELHDQIDAAVAEAYGWPVDLSDEEILERLVALNRERHQEELQGHVRWLRPDYQNPGGKASETKAGKLDLEQTAPVEGKLDWPKALPQQMAMVRTVLGDLGTASVEEVRSHFKRGQKKTVEERLATLAALGQAEALDDGRYAG